MHIDHPLRFVLQVTHYRSRQMVGLERDLQPLFMRYAKLLRRSKKMYKCKSRIV